MRHDLPDLPAGVWRHYKGHLYQVLGYGHDANADTLCVERSSAQNVWHEPIRERTVVVYIGLELDAAHTGPRLAVRTAEDFHALVHTDGSVCDGHDGGSCPGNVQRRFSYVGAAWDGG